MSLYYFGRLLIERLHIERDHSAPDDLQNPERIRFLLKDIREARQAKSREGLAKLDHNELLVSRQSATTMLMV